MWVDNMVDNLTYSYLYTKRDVYYFSKHVPKDIRSHYKRGRIVICLKTKSQFVASRACKSLIQRLEDCWMSLRLSTLSIPAGILKVDNLNDIQQSSSLCIRLLQARDATNWDFVLRHITILPRL